MSVPPRRDPDASPEFDAERGGEGTDSDTTRTDRSETDDSDDADTNPLPALNPYGAGWGTSWGAVPSPDTSRRAEQVERFDRPQHGGRTGRPVAGDVELPPAFEPFASRRRRQPTGRGDRARMALFGVGALAVLAAVGGLTFWLTNRSPASHESDTTTAAEATTATTTTQAPSRDVEAETRLMSMLPPGYLPGACEPTDPAPGSVAMFNCANNSDPGGPTSATYLQARNKEALDAAFTGAVRADAVVNCPGNIQSPGPWLRNATPQLISGTLVCGVQGNIATVAWTDEERMLVSIVRSDPPGPLLDQLYQWWSTPLLNQDEGVPVPCGTTGRRRDRFQGRGALTTLRGIRWDRCTCAAGRGERGALAPAAGAGVAALPAGSGVPCCRSATACPGCRLPRVRVWSPPGRAQSEPGRSGHCRSTAVSTASPRQWPPAGPAPRRSRSSPPSL